ncbi:MAG TPA: hemerythrin domain-containing protein [Planctomycetota bacterium]|nr:hemerythrin domain-containing protein [Planctomycetota bacterium]
MAESKVRARRAIDVLKEDHEKVKQLFADYEELGDGAVKSKVRLFEKIRLELEIHAKCEEELIYPAFAAVAEDEESSDLVEEAKEEHNVVKTLLDELSDLTPEDEAFDAKMAVLCENVEHHIEEEEGDMFKMWKKIDETEREEISGRLLERKRELMDEMSGDDLEE